MIVSTTISSLYEPVAADLRTVERVFDEEIRSEFPFVNELCDTVRSYRGKMMRPALLLLSARACGKLRPEHHVLAAVIEMVHMATLVHDDVLDAADERRRKPTVNRLAGNAAAVLLGDYLISHAFHLCSSLNDQHASRRIGAVTNIVCEGEMLQNAQRGNVNLTEDEYLSIIRRKTSALTAVSCELGAYYAGADPSWVAALTRYGDMSGVAFQIVDDVLDILGDPAQVGKTLGRDLELGKLTLPAIHHRVHVQNEYRTATYASVCNSNDRATMRAELDRTGSIEYAMTVASENVGQAVKELEVLPISDARASLTALAEFIVRRDM